VRGGLATVPVQLLAIVGLMLAGRLQLLWVCWRTWRALRLTAEMERAGQEALANEDLDQSGAIADCAPKKTFGQAALQILIDDVTMSLDNVLAVAGASREQDRKSVV